MSEKTPFYPWAAQAGAAFADEAGWSLPLHFGNPDAEYAAARRGAVAFDLSHHGKVEVAGKESASFLHNLCTNDVKGLSAGSGCEAFLTSAQARTVAHAWIFRCPAHNGEDAFWVDVGPGLGEAMFRHLDRHHISEQLELADRTRDYGQLHVAGPAAPPALEAAGGAPLPPLEELRHAAWPAAGLPRYFVRRRTAVGLPGYDLLVPAEDCHRLWETLRAAGVTPAGRQAYHTLRVEAGQPLFGFDIDATNLPQEVNRTEQTVSFTKGCYIGQETVARIRTYGHVNRALVGLTLDGATAAPPGARVLRDGQEVGNVTSSVVSPRRGRPVALAYVRRGHQEPGTGLEVETPAGRVAATVTPVPFADAGPHQASGA